MNVVQNFAVNEIKARLKHPFMGAFIISFSLFNWKCWLFAFTGSMEPQARIEAIVEQLNQSCIGFWLIPFVSACLFTFLYPIVTAVISIGYHWISIRELNRKSVMDEMSDTSKMSIIMSSSKLANIVMQELVRINQLLQDIERANDVSRLPEVRNKINNLTPNLMAVSNRAKEHMKHILKDHGVE